MAEEKQESQASKAANSAIGKATQAASTAASQVASKATAAAAASTGILAPIAPLIGKAVGAVTSFVTTKLGGFIQRHKTAALAGVAGSAALAIGGLAAIPGLATLGAVALALAAVLALASFVIAALLPFFIFFISFVLFTIFVLFIINSGAYLVPPAPQLGTTTGNLPPGSTAISNPYIEVTKTANPSGPFQNGSVPNPIKYTITIRAKQGALTNIRFTNLCQAISKSGAFGCDAPLPVNFQQVIDAGQTATTTYTANYSGSNFNDSLVTDTFTVTASVQGTSDQTAASSASVVIGNPPNGCFTFTGNWPALQRLYMTQALAKMSAAQNYMAQLCRGPVIKLFWAGFNPGYGGETFFPDSIYIYPKGALDIWSALYTVSHESGHWFARLYGSIQTLYSNTKTNRPICSYPLSPQPYSESFAESIALYITNSPQIGTRLPSGELIISCITPDFKTKYPLDWSFVNTNIFKTDTLGW